MDARFCWCHESCGLWQLFQKCLECISLRICWHETFFYLPAGACFRGKSSAEGRLSNTYFRDKRAASVYAVFLFEGSWRESVVGWGSLLLSSRVTTCLTCKSSTHFNLMITLSQPLHGLHWVHLGRGGNGMHTFLKLRARVCHFQFEEATLISCHVTSFIHPQSQYRCVVSP